MLEGRLRITSEGKEFILEPGDIIEIPAHTPHTADVVGSEAVVSFDATRPPRKKK
ncbi:MAG: cupin domain-containing protein [Terriglobia bacterium]